MTTQPSFCLKHDHRVYLDYNATTPLAKLLPDQIGLWLKEWGNPSSIHLAGRGPKALLREARQSLAQMLGVDPLELIFTSGGSESNNLALMGIFQSLILRGAKENSFKKNSRKRFLLTPVEHPSVKKTMEFMARQGAEVEFISLKPNGEVDLDIFSDQLDERVALVSVMYANNETGYIYPIKKMVKMAHQQGAFFHCDMVQALGKTPIDLKNSEVDLASFSGHKFYALKGSGVLYSRKGVFLESLIHGGGQERGRRAGTENVLAQASLGWMCQFRDQVKSRADKMKEWRDYLEDQLFTQISDLIIIGKDNKRLPNTTSVIINGVDGETLLMNLDMKGISVSTGAACSSGHMEPSPVLLAMGYKREQAQSSLRISTGWDTTQEEIDFFLESLRDIVNRLRSFRKGMNIETSR